MTMREHIQRVIDTVAAWEGVSTAPHRFGGVEFTLGNVEIGHIHSNGMVDIPYTRRIRDALVEDSLAQPHHLLDESGWITTFVRSEAEIGAAIQLYQLSYVQKRFRRRSDRQTDAYQTAVAALPFSEHIKLSLQPQRANEDDEK